MIYKSFMIFGIFVIVNHHLMTSVFGKTNIITRSECNAKEPLNELTPLELPVDRVTINIFFIGNNIKQLPSDLKTQDNVVEDNVLRMVTRNGWLAQPPVNPWVPLELPVERVIILPTITEQCKTQAACTYRVRITQTFNIESQQQDDIIYNFLIGGDGNVYEGRGWNNRGSALKGYNADSISFAYIGSFKKEQPSDKQLNVTRLLLEEGVRLNKLSSRYRIVGANKLEPTSTATSADALYKSFESWPHWSDVNSTVDVNDDEYVGNNGTLCLIERDVWRGHPQTNQLDQQKLPLHRAIISHTATETCDSLTTCQDRVRVIQEFHMNSLKWDDIGYNFLISSDGHVYVGRGWDAVGAHTKGYNYDSIGISFIGTYTTIKPTEAQLNACRLLLEEGVRLKKLAANYHLYGERQLGATESPGEMLYKIIKKWDHWTPNINSH